MTAFQACRPHRPEPSGPLVLASTSTSPPLRLPDRNRRRMKALRPARCFPKRAEDDPIFKEIAVPPLAPILRSLGNPCLRICSSPATHRNRGGGKIWGWRSFCLICACNSGIGPVDICIGSSTRAQISSPYLRKDHFSGSGPGRLSAVQNLFKMSATIRNSCKYFRFVQNAIPTRGTPNRSGHGQSRRKKQESASQATMVER